MLFFLQFFLLNILLLNSFVESTTTTTTTTTTAPTCGSRSSGPVDLPTATFFGKGTYAWAETMILWNCVYNIKDYPSTTPDKSFELAQAAASNNGGGVVYFPAGIYKFNGHLYINSSIAIRGVPTISKAKIGKLPGPLQPTTRFIFPDRKHFGIINIDPMAHDLAVINIAIEFGSIMFWPGLVPSPNNPRDLSWPSSLKTYWYEAKSVSGAGKNKLVLSNTITSVAFGSVDPTNVSSNPWAFRFSHAIGVYSDLNALVANNLLPQSPIGPQVVIHLKGDINPSETQPFPYDLRYGIDNKLLYGAVAGAAVGTGGACGGNGWGTLNPTCASYMFPRNYSVISNYVFNCGRVAYSLTSGCEAGGDVLPILATGIQVIDNHSEHCNNATCWTVDGTNICRGSDTNENRNIDIAGYCANLVNNTAHVYRQIVAHTSYDTVDGECILAQTEMNSPIKSHAWIGNDCTHPPNSGPLATGPIFFYKMTDVRDCVITGNSNDIGQTLGAVFDTTHTGWENNKCVKNNQVCMCGKNPCP